MRRDSLLWTFFPPLLTILLVSLLLVMGFASRSLRGFYLARTTEHLENMSNALAPSLVPMVQQNDLEGVQTYCRSTGSVSDSRLTIILADGQVIGDSHYDPADMDNHADRPEIRTAVNGTTGSSTRYSSTLGHRRLYVAVPGGDITQPTFVVRTSVSLASLTSLLVEAYWNIGLVWLALTLLTALALFLLSRRLSRSMTRLREGAVAFSGGDLSQRLVLDANSEIATVASAMNDMAGELGRRIQTIEDQRNELEAVLTSMSEGIIAIDVTESIIGLNRAGCQLLNVELEHSQGHSIQEVGRNSELTRQVQAVLRGETPINADITLSGTGDTVLRVQASGLRNPDGELIGALVVLDDVTRLRQLENMRRDFVANVSHELKTPITSIKGYVETLQADPPDDPSDVVRFLGIINRQADRLDAIINDLLALSRLEKDTETGGMDLVRQPLAPVIARTVRDLDGGDGGLTNRIKVTCSEKVSVRINAPLLEQALGNLISNAVKYCPADTPIHIRCATKAGELQLRVIDHGPGLAAEHLPRLFERFYRVDKARSRQMGGTGLGLAIVKHIAQAHRGQITVESKPGVGTTFTLHLPFEGDDR